MDEQHRVRALPGRVSARELTPLQAWISLRRLEEEIQTAQEKLRPLVLAQAREIGAEARVIQYGSVHVWLDNKRDWSYDHSPDWVACNNRLNTIEASMRESAKETSEAHPFIAAKRGPVIPMLRVFLHGVPKRLRAGG